MSTIGSAIRQRREALGISRRELARRADISHTQVSRIEADENDPTIGLVVRVATALECTVPDLLPSDPAAAVA